MTNEDETKEYWLKYPLDDLALRCAVLHQQRREVMESLPPREVEISRRTLSNFFIHGVGLELGPGSRPFPIPDGAQCFYGDIRDNEALVKYFSTCTVPAGRIIDAQSLQGIQDSSLDFVISAHVIEHLEDPIGSIVNTLRVLRPGGIFMLVVPDKRYTFDKMRPTTTIDHYVTDYKDGGSGTREDAYEEHIRYVACQVFGDKIAESKILEEVKRLSSSNMDIHFHAWTTDSFLSMLQVIKNYISFDLIGHTLAVNENIFVLKKGGFHV